MENDQKPPFFGGFCWKRLNLRVVRTRLEETQGQLDRQHSQIMRLKDHLDSGEEVYTARGRVYPNSRVKDELKSLFRVYKTTERTVADLEKTLAIREQGLEAAKKQLDETIAQRHELTVEVENLVAEGDAVVARFAYEMTVPTGQKFVARGLTYYALADGRIVEDDPITTPDLFQELGKLMPPPAS